MTNTLHSISISKSGTVATTTDVTLQTRPALNSHHQHDLDPQLTNFSPSTVNMHSLSPPVSAPIKKSSNIVPNLVTSSSDSSLSPVLSSSASSASSSSSSSSSTSPANDSSLVSEDHFHIHLQSHASLLRVVLQRSLPKKFMLGQWQRLDLQILDEFGIPLDGDRAKTSIMAVSCELLEREGTTTFISKDWQVVWQPLHYDAWHRTDETRHMTTCCGFDRSGVGGLEFKVIRSSDNNSGNNNTKARIKKTLPCQLYMRIVPTFDSHQTIHALPLVVGPFSVLSNKINAWQTYAAAAASNNKPCPSVTYQHCQSQQLTSHSHKFWYPANPVSYSQEMYRAFKLGDLDRYMLIKEGWDLGTPGKMWDSALVISDLFVQKTIRHPNSFENLHILDLSAGTGTTGLLIHYIYKHMFPQHQRPRITLTDLPEALPLIYYNKDVNGINAVKKELSVEPLAWGRTSDIQQLQIKSPLIDIIIASDVLYEPTKFGDLVSTLVDLSEPGRTVIYLGYKRRGLKDTEEQLFFDLCYEHFDIQILDYDNVCEEEKEPKIDRERQQQYQYHNKHIHRHHHCNNNYSNDSNNNSNSNSSNSRNNNNGNSDSKDRKNNEQRPQDEVRWETQYGKLMKNRTRMDAEGWLGPFASNWRANHRQDEDEIQSFFQQTGVQVYRLIRKQH